MNQKWVILVAIIAIACQGKKQVDKTTQPDWKQWISADIDSLKKQKIWVDHNTQIDEAVSNKLIKEPDWDDLLGSMMTLETIATDNYTETLDSAGFISISNRVNNDTNALVQYVRIMRNKGKVTVIEIATKEKNMLSERSGTYSYQPQKAFGINLIEKYLWTSPKNIIINAEFLKK